MVKDLFVHVCIVITFLFIGGSFVRSSLTFNSFSKKIIFGTFSGILGSLLMLFTIRLTPTIIMDFRHIGILMSALYGGPLSIAISVLIICLSRFVFITSSLESLLISLLNMVLIGIFSIFISTLKLTELKKMDLYVSVQHHYPFVWLLLSTCTRSFDIISRMGGEEFSVLLFNCSNELALDIGERIRSCIEHHPFILPDGKSICLTISIGAATLMETTHNPDQLVKQADSDLYIGKNTGRNKVCTISIEDK